MPGTSPAASTRARATAAARSRRPPAPPADDSAGRHRQLRLGVRRGELSRRLHPRRPEPRCAAQIANVQTIENGRVHPRRAPRAGRRPGGGVRTSSSRPSARRSRRRRRARRARLRPRSARRRKRRRRSAELNDRAGPSPGLAVVLGGSRRRQARSAGLQPGRAGDLRLRRGPSQAGRLGLAGRRSSSGLRSAWGLGSDAAAYAAAALMAMFALLLVGALLRGNAGAPCACFGARSRVTPWAVLRNLVLAAGFAVVPSLPEADLSTDEWLGLGLGVALLGCVGARRCGAGAGARGRDAAAAARQPGRARDRRRGP